VPRSYWRLPISAHALLVATLFLLHLASPTEVSAQTVMPLSGCSSPTVTTTPSAVTQDNNRGPFTQIFTVTNNCTSPFTALTMSCAPSGNVSCGSVTPVSWTTLGVGASFQDTLTYSTGAGGSGTASLQVNWGDTGGPIFGTLTVTITSVTPPVLSLVVPTLSSGSRAVVNNRTPTLRATILKGTYPVDTTKTALLWRTDTVTKWRGDSLTVARANRGLVEWEVDSVLGLNGAGADSALITVRACDTHSFCSTVTRYAVLPNDSTAALSWLGTPPVVSNGTFSSPFGPGISVSGAEVETGFSSIPYFAMGAPRSAGLVYSTRQSYPRLLVPVTLELRGSPSPDQIVARLFDGVTKLDSLKVTTPACATGGAARCRVVLQGDFSATAFPTPTRKWLKVEVAVTKGTSVRTSVDSIETVVVDRRSTMYGSGWWPSALLKLVAAGSDRVLVGPTGTATIFRGNGDSLYLPPVGSFTGLTKTASGWELRARGDSAVVRFDASGRIRAVQDRNHNVDSLVYGGGNLDTLKSLRDSTAHAMTFAYNSAGRLSSITDAASRVTKDSIDASNRLIYDSLASPAATPLTTRYTYQSYPGTNTVVLATRLGVLTDTTILVYDSTFKRRPVQVKLPAVKDTLGAWVKPTISYTALESRGFGALVRTDSAGAYVEMKDPLTNWTRSWLNRWGQAALTWDAIGVLSRSNAAGDGRALWTAGKLAGDSTEMTRTYLGYDAQQRVVRQWINRAENGRGILRLDSLVYDGNHRVVKRIDSRGQVDSTTYDARGNVIETRDPAGYVTKLWLKTDGRVDSILPPSTTVKQFFTYDATWKQRTATKLTPASSPTLVDSVTYDSYGRVSASFQKIRVRLASGAALQWQWRKSIPYYRVTNQADSTALFRTDECTDPCNSAPAYGTNPAHTRKVGFRFDRAGRDSLRLVSNDTARAVLYVYDRLGRLLVRRPPDSLATPPRDSMVYDVAGNLLKTVTRRGDVITAQYDSRNRTTATVIPGVGTLNRVYGGPLDQLTRLYYTGAVDSIGGVNGEVSYAYDPRGRLLTETSYTGTVVRVDTMYYDSYERDSVTTGPTGKWIVRYDGQRGLLARVVTPFADSATYSFDGQGRLGSAYTQSTGPTQTRSLSYTAASGLARLEHLVNGASDWYPGVYDPEGAPDEPSQGTKALGPTWTEQHGLGAAVDSTVDSLTYDGWERLLSWRESRKTPPGSTWAQIGDSVSFDGAGNVLTVGGAETYGTKKGRLISRTDPVTGNWTYAYDAAGNQTQATATLAGSTKTWNYAYDALNRLVAVRYTPSGGSPGLVARYGYDVLGRRIVKRVYSKPQGGAIGYTRMRYTGSAVAFETDSAGVSITLQYRWGTGVDNLIGVRDSTGTDYEVVQDQLHSVRGLVRRDGTWIMSQRFLPAGQLLSQEHGAAFVPDLRYGWTGREYDAETGLYFNRARSYDPGQRRFTQEDPIGYGGSTNLYAYVDGAVLEGRDPSGLEAMFIPAGGHDVVEVPHGGSEVPWPGQGHSFGACEGGEDFCSINSHLGPECTVREVDGSCAYRGEVKDYYNGLTAKTSWWAASGSLGGPIDRGTPLKGEPNSSQTFRIKGGEQTRYYDSNGDAFLDIESGHHGELGPVHAHDYADGKRVTYGSKTARAVEWFEMIATGIARRVWTVSPIVIIDPCGAAMRGAGGIVLQVCKKAD
jgi:RHS repeat-associated protein